VLQVNASTRWRFARDAGGDFASLDEYLTFNRSAFSLYGMSSPCLHETDLRVRMLDYFNEDMSLEDLVAKHPGFG